jgi:hypothetical protein
MWIRHHDAGQKDNLKFHMHVHTVVKNHMNVPYVVNILLGLCV